MPFALPVGKSVQFGPESLLDRPVLAARIAQVASAWSLLEEGLAQTYAYLLARQMRGSTATGENGQDQAAGLEIFAGPETFGAKLELFRALLRELVQERAPPLPGLLDEVVLPKVAAARNARNRVLHGVWGSCADYPDALVLRPLSGQSQVWRERDFGNEIDLAAEAMDALSYLRNRLYEAFL